MNIALFSATAGMVTYADNDTEDQNAGVNITGPDTTHIKSSFVNIQYERSEKDQKRHSWDQADLMLKTGIIQTTSTPGSRTNSMNGHSTSSIEPVTGCPEEYNYYIVQFNDTVQEMWKQDISKVGGELFDYVPNNAFIFRMNGSTVSTVSKLEQVRWIGEYFPEYKIDPALQAKMEENVSVELMISLFEPVNEGNIKEKVTWEIISLGGAILDGSSDDRIHLNIESSKIPALSIIRDVKWIEGYEPLIVFNDVARGIVNATYVNENYNLTGNGQILAIADTGLDTGVNNASMTSDLYGRILDIQFIGGDGPQDRNGHGTHVTGSAVGNGSLSDGQYKGVAPEAQLVFQSIGYENGTVVVPANLSVLFEYAYELGARIHSNSWGGSGNGSYMTSSKDVDQFMWTHPDMLIVFAAGNSGTDSDHDGIIDNDSISYPGTAKNCLTVGASENNRGQIVYTWGDFWYSDYPVVPINNDYIANDPRGVAAFSSRGPTDDGRIKPDIVAPGTFIISTRSSVSDTVGWGAVNEDYIYMGGTSMATPIAAGGLALIRQNYVDNLNVTPSAALLKATVINGASDMQPGQYGNDVTAQPDYNQGWGLLDLRASLYPDGISIHFADNMELSTGDAVEKNYYVSSSSKPLKITLVWTDHYGTELAQKELVNDLTLLVVQPDGTEVVVNDTINNVEQVLFEEPEAGWYTVKVAGESVPMGPQPCAIVVSGAADAIDSLSFTPEQTTYYTGSRTTFEAEAFDENNNSISTSFRWESSDPTVATIDSSTGYFRALDQGVTNITVYAGTLSSTITITVERSTSSSSSSGGGGGGGGGGGTSGESLANIIVKDPETVFISKDTNIKYEFTEEKNSIGYVEFTALKNSGKITAVVEALNGRSSFTRSDAPGKVYQNVNIWVGKTGFATKSNIADPVIGFKVLRSWMANNDVEKTSIRLYRYSSDVWNELPTRIMDEDERYVYYESETPGFSPFAISAEEKTTEFLTQTSGAENDTSDNGTKLLGQIIKSNNNDSERDSLEDQDKSSGDKFGYLSKFTIASIILVISGMVYRYYKKRK